MKNDARPSPLLRLHLALIALLALALPSCIDVEQDIWLADDGGGRVVMKIGISKQMMKMMSGFGNMGEGESEGEGAADANDPFEIVKIQTALAENANVTSFNVTEEEDEKFNYMIVDMELADITKLEDVQADVMSDSPAAGAGDEDGEFSITRTDEGTYKIAAKLASPGGEDLGAGGMMLKGMVGDASITFRVHANPISHNGTEEGDAIVWMMPLSDLMAGKGLEIDGEFEPSGLGGGTGASATTFWIVLASVLVLALVLFFVFRAQRPKLA